MIGSLDITKELCIKQKPLSRDKSSIDSCSPDEELNLCLRELHTMEFANVLHDRCRETVKDLVRGAIESGGLLPPCIIPGIPFVCGTFMKFVHHAQSVVEADDSDLGRVVKTLVFFQHLQFYLTNGIAIVSDYQGQWQLLFNSPPSADKDIMVSPVKKNSMYVYLNMFQGTLWRR